MYGYLRKSRLEFGIDTDRAPLRVDLAGYPEGLDDEGAPTGEPELLACTSDGGSTGCTYAMREGDTGMTVTADVPETTRFVILNVAWATSDFPSPSSGEVALSWVFDIDWH